MKILAFDTSSTALSVALLEDENLVAEATVTVKKNHSISLMPTIDFLVAQVSWQPADLDRVVVAQGPGSYTGLRVAVATAKTLAYALNIDLVGVSSLQALMDHSADGVVIPIMDARRNNVYVGFYENGQAIIPDRHAAFTDVLDFIKPGQTTELQVANFLDFRMREYGASGISFESIIASGYRSAMPHGVASDKVIQSGETLTMDFGCYYNHYVSDMTRTIHIGETTDEEREIYDIVLRSNRALIDATKAGMTRRDYDKVARDVIVEAGYGDYFTHGIGHGIGLDIHEIPYFGNSDETIEAGMVLTDEPGIYLADKYGVRIEDDIIITENGCEVITLAPKELIVL